MPGSDNPTIETRKVSSVLRRTQEMVEEFDTKSVEAIHHMLRIWKISHIPPIKLVHNNIETIYVLPVRNARQAMRKDTMSVFFSSHECIFVLARMHQMRLSVTAPLASIRKTAVLKPL